jgi:hypothetical protein
MISRPVSWDLLTKSGVEDSRFHPGLAGSSFAVEKPNWTTELTSSAPQQSFEFFSLLLELLGAVRDDAGLQSQIGSAAGFPFEFASMGRAA